MRIWLTRPQLSLIWWFRNFHRPTSHLNYVWCWLPALAAVPCGLLVGWFMTVPFWNAVLGITAYLLGARLYLWLEYWHVGSALHLWVPERTFLIFEGICWGFLLGLVGLAGATFLPKPW